MTPRFVFKYCAVLLIVLFAAGCLSPTLPLPPPDDVSVTSPDSFGMVTVEGKVNDDAYVACLNERTESGVIEKSGPEGYFNLKIAAQAKDALTLWQIIGSDFGPPRSFEVPSEEESE